MKVKINLGDIINSVYEEVEALPLTNQAKSAMVMYIVGEMLTRNGYEIKLATPVNPIKGDYTDYNGLEFAVQA